MLMPTSPRATVAAARLVIAPPGLLTRSTTMKFVRQLSGVTSQVR
jgi:hypothetical protein